MDDDTPAGTDLSVPAAGNTIESATLMVSRPTGSGTEQVPLEQARISGADRMSWLPKLVRERTQRIELWPALLSTPKTVSRVTLGPFGDTDMVLGHFLRAAQDLGVANVYARYLSPPSSEPAELGDGLVAQFVYGGILHVWSGVPLDGLQEQAAEQTASSHPDRDQQEVIDHIVAQLAADPGYRVLTRKSDRDNYARTENGELAEALRGEHPVLPPNFVYRVLQAAAGKVDHSARSAYADVEDHLQDLLDELDADPQYLTIADKTARRHHLRTMLFERYGHFAPPSTLVARLLDATNHSRPVR